MDQEAEPPRQKPISQDIRCPRQVVPKTMAVPHPVKAGTLEALQEVLLTATSGHSHPAADSVP